MIPTFNEYSAEARSTEFFPRDLSIAYLVIGLAGETGELCNKYKKVLRDEGGELTEQNLLDMRKEVGDVLWYLDRLAENLGTSLGAEAFNNIKKLKDRQARGVVAGSGDNR